MLQCRDAYLDADPEWRREKWVAEDNLHVTLRFLGNVDDDMAACIPRRFELPYRDRTLPSASREGSGRAAPAGRVPAVG